MRSRNYPALTPASTARILQKIWQANGVDGFVYLFATGEGKCTARWLHTSHHAQLVGFLTKHHRRILYFLPFVFDRKQRRLNAVYSTPWRGSMHADEILAPEWEWLGDIGRSPWRFKQAEFVRPGPDDLHELVPVPRRLLKAPR